MKSNLNIKKKLDINQKKIIFFTILILFLIVIGFIIFIFLNGNKSKVSNIGNNSSSQEIVDYILNMTSYQAEINVEVKSNKNSNKYIIKQEYNEQSNIQEIVEPSNMQGIKIIKKDTNLTLENSKLDLVSVLENYNYIADNILDLSFFVDNYKNDSTANYEEKNSQIIMNTVNNKNKYTKYMKLYIDKNTGKPINMEINDNNKNTTIYIIYNEISINI